MPVIHTHVSVPTTPEQREALKSAYGKAITAVPGKSEGWLMCPFEDNMPIYFAGDDSKPAAYVEVNVFGSSVPGNTERRVSIAFCPVTTIATHSGIWDKTFSGSIGRTTSRNLSEAFAFKRITSMAVSPIPIPFSRQKAFAFSSLNAFLSRRNASLFP